MKISEPDIPMEINREAEMNVISRDDVRDPADEGWINECKLKFGGLGIRRQPNSVSLIKVAGVKPINLRLQQKKPDQTQLKPRRYQEELFLKTLQDNVIIYLGTGLGKTFIVVLFLNSPKVDFSISSGRKVAFLAPTQDLVSQQAEYIYTKVPYKVRVYCGRTSHLGIHIDMWQEETWQAELKQIDILFMTPQIFSSAISTGYLKWSQFSAVIFDEAHHAATSDAERKGKKKGSPYSQVLKHYSFFKNNLDPKPRFIALTASLINNMPKDSRSIYLGIQDLENKFSATCVTDISVIGSKPRMVIYNYTTPKLNRYNDKIIRVLQECYQSLEGVVTAKNLPKGNKASLSEEEKDFLAYSNRVKLASYGFSIKPTSFHKIIRQLIAIRTNTGLWTLANVCYNLHMALLKHIDSPLISPQIRPLYVDFSSIMRYLVMMVKDFLGSEPSSYLDYMQPKVLCLLEILKNEYKRVIQGTEEKSTFSCIVFVKSRIEVYALCGFLQKISACLPGYEFIKADYAIGLAATQASKWACITMRKSVDQAVMLEAFRSNSLNVIVTTSVLEEGIDLPVCSTVIRYDSTDTFRVYVQSRGRARQQKSSFIAMCNDESLNKTYEALVKFSDFEDRVKERLSENNKNTLPPRAGINSELVVRGSTNLDEDVFIDEEKAIRIDSGMAKIILNMYCNRLLSRDFYSDGLMYERELRPEGSYMTTLFFPAGAAIKEGIKGGPRSTPEAADSSAAVAAYRALHVAGELDEHGVPIRMTEEHIDKILASHNLQPDFSSLSRDMDGEVSQRGNVSYYTFPWKLFHIGTSLCRGYVARSYNMYRLNFVAYDGAHVRVDVRPYLEKQTLGIIVDSNRKHNSWPRHIYSHYGQFTVEYELLRDDFKMLHYREHNELASYTHRFAINYWKVGRLPKHNFIEKCLFYLVPLDGNGHINWDMVRRAFSTRPVRGFERNDIVRLGCLYRRHFEDHSKSYVVEQVSYSMNIHSQVPGSRFKDTFEQRLRRNFGESIPIQDASRPIIQVRPISQELARTSQGKKIDVNQTTATIEVPEQCLEAYESDVSTSYQAYLLPVIIYRIYLTSLSSELNLHFQEQTRDYRRIHHLDNHKKSENPQKDTQSIIVEERRFSDGEEAENNEEFSSGLADEMDLVAEIDSKPEDPVEQDTDEDEEDVDEVGGDVNEDEENVNEDEEDIVEVEDVDEDEEECYLSDSSDLSEQSSDYEPKPYDRYRDILSRQKFSLNQRDESGMERWDMSEYNVPDLKHIEIKIENFTSSQKYLDTNPRMPDDTSWITPIRTHNNSIIASLSNFRKNIMANCDFQVEEEVYKRPGQAVDLSIIPPITFDRKDLSQNLMSNMELEFLEAMTQGKSGEQPNLEALESLGDSYLKYCVSVVLFQRLDRNEGQLTYARSRLVSNKHFCHLAKKKKLGQYAICRKFDSEILPSLLGGRICSENTLRSKDLADMFEALVGACLSHRGEYEAIMALKWLGLNLFEENTFAELHENCVTFAKPPSAFYKEQNTELMNQSKKRVQRFQDIISYKFADRSYLVQAFTHASSPLRCTDSYERLEFLGDAVLDYLITMTLYKLAGIRDPGVITSSRSALVNNCTFAKLAIRYKFDIFIQHANQKLYDELNGVNEYAKSEPTLEFMDDFRFDGITKFLADLFESVAGAIYIDSGCSLDAVFNVYYPMMRDIIEAEIKNPTKNLVTQLYELFPGRDRIEFEFVKSAADTDEILTTAICKIYGLPAYHGEGYSKSQAKKRAVADALNKLPSQQDLEKLNQEYQEILEKRLLAELERGSRGSRRGVRGGVRGGSRGNARYARRGTSCGRWTRGHEGRGNYSNTNRNPYPTKSVGFQAHGHHLNKRHRKP